MSHNNLSHSSHSSHSSQSSHYLDQKHSFTTPQVVQHGSHMIMSNVMKELKTKYLSLDTKFAQGNQDLSLASCTFNLPERITGIESISVSSVHLPLTYYNISTQLENNSFRLYFDTVVTTIIIPDGFYSLANLTSTINKYLPSSVTFALSSGPERTGACQFTFLANETQKSLTIRFNTDGTGKPNKWDFKSRLGWILGFRLPAYTFASSFPSNLVSSSIVTEGMTNLYTLKYIFLVLDEFSSSSHSSSFHSFLPNSLLSKNILAHISLDSKIPWGGFQNATIHNGLLVSDTRKFSGDRVDLQKCQVQLVNEFGRVISLNQNDFSFVLELKYI